MVTIARLHVRVIHHVCASVVVETQHDTFGCGWNQVRASLLDYLPMSPVRLATLGAVISGRNECFVDGIYHLHLPLSTHH